MPEYVLAGASCIEDIPYLLDAADRVGASVCLLENGAMYDHIPAPHRHLVTRAESLPDLPDLVLPLNEFWVSQAGLRRVSNIPTSALCASRSKHYLSERLAQWGLHHQSRRYLDAQAPPYPTHYLARLDAAYSGYGIVRHIELGEFDPERIAVAVLAQETASMRTMLGGATARVVVEDYLQGDEFSADVLVRNGHTEVLRLFRKIVVWKNGRPVCDSYIAMPMASASTEEIRRWCHALFGDQATSFGHFDFIVAHGRMIPIDFSCRLGGGMDAIKQYAGIRCYAAAALFNAPAFFPPYTVQKNIVLTGGGHITGVQCSVPEGYRPTLRKRAGDLVPPNTGSANARIAEVCFSAQDLQDAMARAEQLDRMVVADVCH